jgi:predicted PolB exonuclease-like 3'-5' exonuclease
VEAMIDSKIKVHCTDNGRDFDMHVLSYRAKTYIDVAFETLKIRLVYKAPNRVFIGSLGGREFTFKESDLPEERREFTR